MKPAYPVSSLISFFSYRSGYCFVLLAIFGLCSTSPLAAKEIYVSPMGSDRAKGTEQSPLKTIQHAVNSARPGDTFYLLPGVYREQVLLKSNGSQDKPIRIVAKGEVLIDGTELLTGTWQQHRSNIYKIPLRGKRVEQAFIDKQPLTLARWPNARFNETWDRDKWAKSNEDATRDLMVSDALAATNVDWTGAIAVLNVAHQYKTWTRKILDHTAGTDRFSYDFNERLPNPVHWNDDRFYITGTIKALDAPGEFFHDAEAGWFYYVTENGHAPSPGSIAVKRRDYAITGNGRKHIELIGLDTFASAHYFSDSSHIRMANFESRFPAYRMMIGESAKQGRVTPFTGATGNNNVVENCHVAYASGSGIMMVGQNNRVENCVVHDVNFSGHIDFKGIGILGNKDQPSQSLARRNTVYNTGNIGIEHRGYQNIVEHNLVHHTGLACLDIAAIHTGGALAAGSIVRHNIVHSSSGKGIRGDNQTRKLTVHHNLVYNSQEGIIVKGAGNKVYHNTVIGFGKRDNLIIPTRREPKLFWTRYKILDVQNTDSLIFNNYVGLVKWRHKPVDNPGISHNLEYNDYDFVDQLVHADRSAMNGDVDARPVAGSYLVDAGRIVANLNEDFQGKAPDIGAFEYQQIPWKAGADLKIGDEIAMPIKGNFENVNWPK